MNPPVRKFCNFSLPPRSPYFNVEAKAGRADSKTHVLHPCMNIEIWGWEGGSEKLQNYCTGLFALHAATASKKDYCSGASPAHPGCWWPLAPAPLKTRHPWARAFRGLRRGLGLSSSGVRAVNSLDPARSRIDPDPRSRSFFT